MASHPPLPSEATAGDASPLSNRTNPLTTPGPRDEDTALRVLRVLLEGRCCAAAARALGISKTAVQGHKDRHIAAGRLRAIPGLRWRVLYEEGPTARNYLTTFEAHGGEGGMPPARLVRAHAIEFSRRALSGPRVLTAERLAGAPLLTFAADAPEAEPAARAHTI